MRWNILFGMQATLLVAGLYVTTLWPSTGGPAVLIPVFASGQSGWAWTSSEDPQIVEINSKADRLTVIVPSQSSLVRAVSQGFIPIAADPASCTAPVERQQMAPDR